MKIVVDSSILIDYIRGGERWVKFIRESEEELELYLPTIVVFELFSGKSTKAPEHEKEVHKLLKNFQLIQLTTDIAKQAGEIYRDVSSSLGVADYLIAASAISINGQVLTLNQKHFKQIPGLKIYEL